MISEITWEKTFVFSTAMSFVTHALSSRLLSSLAEAAELRKRPQVHMLKPLVRLQLLAYRAGLTLGRDIDRPRNLAKSVTVE